MGRGWRPILVGATVVLGVFVLAQARPFEPEAPSGAPAAGDPARGEVLFEERCAPCHGTGGAGGSPGPRLIGSGLDAAAVAAVVEQGKGVMPAGTVSGGDRDDVAAYVASIASG